MMTRDDLFLFYDGLYKEFHWMNYYQNLNNTSRMSLLIPT